MRLARGLGSGPGGGGGTRPSGRTSRSDGRGRGGRPRWSMGFGGRDAVDGSVPRVSSLAGNVGSSRLVLARSSMRAGIRRGRGGGRTRRGSATISLSSAKY